MIFFDITYAATLSSISDEVVSVIQILVSTAGIIAVLFFLWNLVKLMVVSEYSDSDRSALKNRMIWGLVALMVLFSVYGIIEVIRDFFGIDTASIFKLTDVVHAQSKITTALSESFGILNTTLASFLVLIFIFAILFFVYRLFTYITNIHSSSDRAKSASYIINSLIILFVIFSFSSIIFVFRNALGIPSTDRYPDRLTLHEIPEINYSESGSGTAGRLFNSPADIRSMLFDTSQVQMSPSVVGTPRDRTQLEGSEQSPEQQEEVLEEGREYAGVFSDCDSGNAGIRRLCGAIIHGDTVDIPVEDVAETIMDTLKETLSESQEDEKAKVDCIALNQGSPQKLTEEQRKTLDKRKENCDSN